jgi:hypothetical protein
MYKCAIRSFNSWPLVEASTHGYMSKLQLMAACRSFNSWLHVEASTHGCMPNLQLMAPQQAVLGSAAGHFGPYNPSLTNIRAHSDLIHTRATTDCWHVRQARWRRRRRGSRRLHGCSRRRLNTTLRRRNLDTYTLLIEHGGDL